MKTEELEQKPAGSPLSDYEFGDLQSGDLAAVFIGDIETLEGLGSTLQELVGDIHVDEESREFKSLIIKTIGDLTVLMAKRCLEKVNWSEQWLADRGFAPFSKVGLPTSSGVEVSNRGRAIPKGQRVRVPQKLA